MMFPHLLISINQYLTSCYIYERGEGEMQVWSTQGIYLYSPVYCWACCLSIIEINGKWQDKREDIRVSERFDDHCTSCLPSRNWPWISMKVHGRSWNFMVKSMDFHVSPCWIIKVHGFPWKSMSLKCNISSKFMDRFVYEKCCVLTTWKFIDFHVNPSLATNGNEQFVWVFPDCHGKKEQLLYGTKIEYEYLCREAVWSLISEEQIYFWTTFISLFGPGLFYPLTALGCPLKLATMV